jgi:hypothetical protein
MYVMSVLAIPRARIFKGKPQFFIAQSIPIPEDPRLMYAPYPVPYDEQWQAAADHYQNAHPWDGDFRKRRAEVVKSGDARDFYSVYWELLEIMDFVLVETPPRDFQKPHRAITCAES